MTHHQPQTRNIAQKLKSLSGQFPDLTLTAAEEDLLVIPIGPERAMEVLGFLRDDPEFAMTQLSDLTAVDQPDKGEITMLYRLLHPASAYDTVVVKVGLPRDNPAVQTATGLWANADWYEREVYDMFGVDFPGHPDLRRILTWDEFQGHPLRKDFRLPEWREEMEAHG